MLIKFGGGVVDARGSQAGNTYSRNRFGAYIRARIKGVDPKSSRQGAARIRMMTLAEQWRESPMDAAKRGAWETYAASVSWLNKLGEAVNLTGYNHYMRSNAAIAAAGGTRVDDGPTSLGLPGADETVVPTALGEGSTISIAFDDALDWCAEVGGYMLIEVGVPQNATRNFFGGPWRVAGAIAGAVEPVSSPQTVPTPWTLVEGQKIWTRVKIIRADGRVSTPFQTAPILVGPAA